MDEHGDEREEHPMDRSLNNGREFGPPAHELFEDHASRLLEVGKVAHRLNSQHRVGAGWSELSARIGRNDKPGILLSAVVSGVMSEREIRRGLEDTWTTCEWPGRAADHEVRLYMFELAGVDEDLYLHEAELRDRAELPDSVALYRAAAEGHQTGLSWTTSFERAHWFATRLGAIAGRQHEIYETTAPRESILATFHQTRGEHEHVIDTGRIDPVMPAVVDRDKWQQLLDLDLRTDRNK